MNPDSRLAYLVSHPIQYQAPLLRRIASEPGIDLTVFFISDFSLREYRDEGFGAALKWDIPLLGGYKHEMLETVGDSFPVTGIRPWVKNLRSVLRNGNFDVLWLHGYSQVTSLRAIAMARKLGIKTLVRSDGQLASAEGRPAVRRIKAMAVRRLFRLIDGFLSVGSMNSQYYEYFGVAPDRIFDLPYAVDNEFFQSRALAASGDRESLRRLLGLEPGRPIILFASKLIERKRAIDLLEAYALLPRENGEPNPYLLFVGDGEERPNLEQRLRELDLASVRFLGFRNQGELPALLDLCDVFVLPSVREPFGLIVNEAMNAARPVIVTDEVGAAPDLVENGANGYVVPARDLSALASALHDVTSNTDKAKRMGLKSKEMIDRWDFESNVAGLWEALGSLLPERTSHARSRLSP